YEILREGAAPGDWVLDPFCGRGTTNYAARIVGLPSIGVDSCRVAAAIAEAKLANTTPHAVVEEAQRALGESPVKVPAGEFWELAFHEDVLPRICQLRDALLDDCGTDVRKALRAIVMGALHGPLKRGTRANGTHGVPTSYLSNQSPRTFAPKPRYAVKFWRERGLSAPHVDVLEVIRARAERYYGKVATAGTGEIILGDSRLDDTWAGRKPEVRWVITSPPYYGMYTYNPDQWLRLWFLGGSPTVDYSSAGQLHHTSPEVFAADLRAVWRNVASICRPGARLVVRFGGIHDRRADPLSILKASLEGSGWSILRVEPAGSAAAGRRQALHFLGESRAPREEYDLWAHYAPL
ncbi:MAG: DNA modification methylase, partial [Chloroflexi bacterium]|nr:DNA modification methylase [Chloroflexota bacterium]